MPLRNRVSFTRDKDSPGELSGGETIRVLLTGGIQREASPGRFLGHLKMFYFRQKTVRHLLLYSSSLISLVMN